MWSDITSVTPCKNATRSQFKTFSRVVSRSNTPCTKDDTNLTAVMKLFGLQGRTEKESAAKVALDITWHRGWVHFREQGGREEFCLSLIPPAWRLRTENLFSTSGVTLPNYPLKVLPQSSHRQDFLLSASVTPSLFLSLSFPLCYIYILPLPVIPPLTPTPSLSVSLPAFVPPNSSLSASVF